MSVNEMYMRLHNPLKKGEVVVASDQHHKKKVPVGNDLEDSPEGLTRSGVKYTDMFHLLPGNFAYEYDWRVSLVEGLGKHPQITVPVRLDRRFTGSLASLLEKVPPEHQEKVMVHAMRIIKHLNFHIIATPDHVSLAIRQKRREEYDLPFKITEKGYHVHPSYTRNSGLVTHSGGVLIGQDPYYISAIDQESRYPHTILTSVGEVLPDPLTMPGLNVRTGIIIGAQIHKPYEKIQQEFFDSELLYRLREGVLEEDQVPHAVVPFIYIHELPKKKK